jgi:energy-converting hydrogenase A subunit M
MPDSDVPLGWAVAVLERIVSEDAKVILHDLAACVPDRRPTQEAIAALKRTTDE